MWLCLNKRMSRHPVFRRRQSGRRIVPSRLGRTSEITSHQEVSEFNNRLKSRNVCRTIWSLGRYPAVYEEYDGREISVDPLYEVKIPEYTNVTRVALLGSIRGVEYSRH